MCPLTDDDERRIHLHKPIERRRVDDGAHKRRRLADLCHLQCLDQRQLALGHSRHAGVVVARGVRAEGFPLSAVASTTAAQRRETVTVPSSTLSGQTDQPHAVKQRHQEQQSDPLWHSPYVHTPAGHSSVVCLVYFCRSARLNVDLRLTSPEKIFQTRSQTKECCQGKGERGKGGRERERA